MGTIGAEAAMGRARAAERRVDVAESVLRGVPRKELAARWGVTDQTIYDDLKLIRAKWQEEAVEAVATATGRELRACDADEDMIRGWLAGVSPLDTELRLKHLDRIGKIAERRARLLGCEAPKRVELSGPGGGPIASASVTLDLAALLLADPEAAGHAAALLGRMDKAKTEGEIK